jgi:hypothetical protein
VLHGGGAGDPAKRETWTFDGRAWSRVTDTGPPRRYARMMFDARTKAMLLYGGFDREPSNELWRFSGGAWNIVR